MDNFFCTSQDERVIANQWTLNATLIERWFPIVVNTFRNIGQYFLTMSLQPTMFCLEQRKQRNVRALGIPQHQTYHFTVFKSLATRESVFIVFSSKSLYVCIYCTYVFILLCFAIQNEGSTDRAEIFTKASHHAITPSNIGTGSESDSNYTDSKFGDFVDSRSTDV